MLVKTALEDPGSLTDADLRQLAYYSWYDNEEALLEDAPPELFNSLAVAAAVRDSGVSARLYMQYLVMLANETTDDAAAEEAAKVDPEKLRVILDSPELVIACWDYLTFSPKNIIPVMRGSETEIKGLQDHWAEVARNNRHHVNLSTTKQLYGWLPYLAFYFQGDEEEKRPLPEDVIASIRADGQAADEKTRNHSSRLSVISAATNVYRVAGLTDDARSLMMAEVDQSKTPHYFMSNLAYLEEEEGNNAQALEWHRRAYEASSGPNTRFQWGAGYVKALIRLAPEDGELISGTTLALFEELQSMEEAFAGHNFRTLERLSDSFETWDEEHHSEQSMLAGFRAHLKEMCDGQVVGSPELAHCTSLLAPRVAGSG
jgi:hypothetical protein